MTAHPHHIRSTDAVIQTALKALIDKSGRLDPARVVQVAARPSHPLHNYFEWDDTKAAQAHRITQARALIREVRVVVRTEVQIVTGVAYVRDPSAGARERGYVALHTIKPASESAREVMRQEMVRVEGALSRARAVAAMVGLADELDVMVRAAALINGRLGDVA